MKNIFMDTYKKCDFLLSTAFHPIIFIFNAMFPPDSTLSSEEPFLPVVFSLLCKFFQCSTSLADLRGELFIPQCVPTGRVVLVLKQRDLAERGKTAPSLPAGAAFIETKQAHTHTADYWKHVLLYKYKHAICKLTYNI